MGQRWQSLVASGLPPLLATCAIGAAVEFGWAAGEAVLVPFLTTHGVRRWLVSTIYLANPTLGIWVQPILGALSDRINRRVPFIVALSTIALVGISTLVAAIPLTKALGFEPPDDGEGTISPVTIAVAFAGFGAADICFDCLLVPGRALLDDQAVPAGRSEESHALFTGFQLGGRLIALLAGSSYLTTSGLWGLYDSADAHFDACLTVSALFLMGSTFAVVVLVDDRGSTYDTIPSCSENNSAESHAAEIEFEEEGGMPFDDCRVSQPYPSQEAMFNHHVDNSHQSVDIMPGQTLTAQSSICIPDATVILCVVQAMGWVGVCAQSFFWTSWRGEEVGCVDLALQGLVGMATVGLLPLANARFGAAPVWFCSELFFHLLMMSVAFVSSLGESVIERRAFQQHGSVPRIICALSGVNYAVHATNGLIVAMDLVSDPSRRARTIAMVNNALPMGQLLTALSGGAVAQYFGGFEYVFVCYGLIGSAVTSFSWAISSRRSLFSGSSNG